MFPVCNLLINASNFAHGYVAFYYIYNIYIF